MKIRVMVFSVLIGGSLTCIAQNSNQVDLSKLQASKQQNYQENMPEIDISYHERKQARDNARQVETGSIVGSAVKNTVEGAFSEPVKMDSITVEADCIAGLAGCIVEDFSLSGGPTGIKIDKFVKTYHIYRYNEKTSFYGTYHYVIRTNGKKVCTGSFQLDGSSKNVKVNVYEDGCNAYLTTY